MKKIVLLFLCIFIFSGCSSSKLYENNISQNESLREIEGYPIVFEDRITEEGYYNGPLEYTKEREEFERRDENWNKRVDKFYSNNE